MINSLLAAEFFEPLCLTLLHSLWQVAVLALIDIGLLSVVVSEERLLEIHD